MLRGRGNDSYLVRATAAIIVEEYIVGPSPMPTAGSPADDVIDVPAPAAPSDRTPAPPSAPDPPVGAPAPTPSPAEPMPAPFPPVAEPMPALSPTPAERMPVPAPPAGQPAASAQSIQADELALDLQAILSGAKVYDPASGRTVPRDQVGAAAPPPPPPVRPTEAPNEQAIFDRIAESMSYANAYDLGTVEVDNRFTDFDRFDDLAGKHRDAKRARPEDGQPAVAEQKVTSKDFIEDLDALSLSADETDDPEVRDTMAAIGRAAAKAIYAVDQSCGPTAANAGIAVSAREYAAPMYDAGEHVLAGADQYKDALLVGQSPGVRFSYADLLAMGDLYEDAQQMQNASVAELTKLKELIERSTRFYAGAQAGKADPSLDVSHSDWDRATASAIAAWPTTTTSISRRTCCSGRRPPATTRPRGSTTTAWPSRRRSGSGSCPRTRTSTTSPSRRSSSTPSVTTSSPTRSPSGHLVNKAVLIDRFKRNFYTSAGQAQQRRRHVLRARGQQGVHRRGQAPLRSARGTPDTLLQALEHRHHQCLPQASGGHRRAGAGRRLQHRGEDNPRPPQQDGHRSHERRRAPAVAAHRRRLPDRERRSAS